MSLITQCPACGTLFKVVADQLKISEGWVRCGQCVEVFDAQAHMASPQAAWVAPHPPPPRTLSVSTEPAPNGLEIDLPLITTEPILNSVKLATPEKFADSVSTFGASLPAPGLPANAPASVTLPPSAPTAKLTPSTPSAPSHADITPGFVRQARRAQRWQSPWVRAGLTLVVLALFALMGLQVARQERDRIASAQPDLLPWLQKLCAVTECTVSPLKQIDAVVVEASSFNKLRTDGKYELYKLVLNLKNTSTLAVAMPHIELSLNDAQDQAVLRRVLSPSDLASLLPVLAANTEFSASTAIQIDNTQLAGTRIAGYRVWAFYP